MKHPILLAATLLTTVSSFAGPAAPAPTGKAVIDPVKASDPCDEMWAWTTLYKSDSNPFLQEFAFTGRPGVVANFSQRPGGILGDFPPAGNHRIVELTEVARLDGQDRRVCRPKPLVDAGPPGQTTSLMGSATG